MNEKALWGIYGASGFGREVLPIARCSISKNPSSSVNLVFIDDSFAGQFVNGTEVLSYENFLKMNASDKFVSVAIADYKIRNKLTSQCEVDGVNIKSLIHNNAVVMDEVQIAEGSIISPFVTLTSNIKIGKSFHANIYSYVAHDCVIGDYVTFAPSVHCNGNVHIHDYAYIGTGAIIKQGNPQKPLVIGEGAVVGMGAVVTKSVPAGAVVVGNPAKPLRAGLGGGA